MIGNIKIIILGNDVNVKDMEGIDLDPEEIEGEAEAAAVIEEGIGIKPPIPRKKHSTSKPIICYLYFFKRK